MKTSVAKVIHSSEPRVAAGCVLRYDRSDAMMVPSLSDETH
jgi:hypothetical protein